jgi:hypothetical protein
MSKPHLPARVRQNGTRRTREAIQHAAKQPSPTKKAPRQPASRQQVKQQLRHYYTH